VDPSEGGRRFGGKTDALFSSHDMGGGKCGTEFLSRDGRTGHRANQNASLLLNSEPCSLNLSVIRFRSSQGWQL
jgi:hypothetical protein